MKIQIAWENFKTVVTAKKLFTQYCDSCNPGYYTIWADDGSITYEIAAISHSTFDQPKWLEW